MSDEDRVFAKCAWRLIPFMVLLFLVNFIARTNAGFAAEFAAFRNLSARTNRLTPALSCCH